MSTSTTTALSLDAIALRQRCTAALGVLLAAAPVIAVGAWLTAALGA
jgi:hypothetical protein